MYQDHPIQIVKNAIHLVQSVLSNIYYGFPARNLKILAVTGTDGKTTTTLMLYHVLKESGHRVGYISTISAKVNERELDTGLHVTTPDPWMVPKYLKLMREEKIEYVILEATSNGLQQNRLWGIPLSGAIITNIKSDHLDYHRTWANYAKAKLRIVKMLNPGATLVLNKDDNKSYNWIRKSIRDKSNLNITSISQVDVQDVKYSINGIDFRLNGVEFSLNLIGKFNLQNALEVISLASNFVDLKMIAKALSTFTPPKGRMEIIQKEPFTVIIDFAHTPNSLQNALKCINDLRSANQKLIAVYGCAGKRDKKRREMGKVSARLADITILTSEDPRNENLEDINNEIINYAVKEGGEVLVRFKNHQEFRASNIENIKESLAHPRVHPIIAFDENSIRSRQDAISLAVNLAKAGDIVYITGKAHEKSMAFGANEEEFPWSEHREVRAALNKQIA